MYNLSLLSYAGEQVKLAKHLDTTRHKVGRCTMYGIKKGDLKKGDSLSPTLISFSPIQSVSFSEASN